MIEALLAKPENILWIMAFIACSVAMGNILSHLIIFLVRGIALSFIAGIKMIAIRLIRLKRPLLGREASLETEGSAKKEKKSSLALASQIRKTSPKAG